MIHSRRRTRIPTYLITERSRNRTDPQTDAARPDRGDIAQVHEHGGHAKHEDLLAMVEADSPEEAILAHRGPIAWSRRGMTFYTVYELGAPQHMDLKSEWFQEDIATPTGRDHVSTTRLTVERH